MSESTNPADRPEYIPYNAEHNLSTLLVVSIPMLYGGDRFRLEAAMMDDTGLLESVESQASTKHKKHRVLLAQRGTPKSQASVGGRRAACLRDRVDGPQERASAPILRGADGRSDSPDAVERR